MIETLRELIKQRIEPEREAEPAHGIHDFIVDGELTEKTKEAVKQFCEENGYRYKLCQKSEGYVENGFFIDTNTYTKKGLNSLPLRDLLNIAVYWELITHKNYSQAGIVQRLLGSKLTLHELD
jgi:hypothetical protein